MFKFLIVCKKRYNFISETSNAQLDNAKDIDIAMPMYNVIECGDNYSKTSESLWHYYRDIPYLDADGAIVDFHVSFKFKTKIAGRIGNDSTNNVKIRVLLKYFK